MPNIIFNDSIGLGITSFFLLGVVIAVFLSIKEMDSVYHYNTNGRWGNLKL